MSNHFTTRRSLAPGAVLVATALALAGCSGDDDAQDAASDVSVELSADAQAALDEAQEAAEQAEEATEQAREDAEDALDDVLASVPELPQGEPSDNDQADADGDVDVDASLPSADQLEELGECFGIDFGELGELGDLDLDVGDFEELEEALEQFEDLDLGTAPGGSVPFDMTIFEELAEMGEMTPEEIQQLVEEQLEQLQGAMSSMPDMSIPPMSMPDFSVPSLPFDPAELEDCLNDAADG